MTIHCYIGVPAVCPSCRHHQDGYCYQRRLWLEHTYYRCSGWEEKRGQRL